MAKKQKLEIRAGDNTNLIYQPSVSLEVCIPVRVRKDGSFYPVATLDRGDFDTRDYPNGRITREQLEILVRDYMVNFGITNPENTRYYISAPLLAHPNNFPAIDGGDPTNEIRARVVIYVIRKPKKPKK